MKKEYTPFEYKRPIINQIIKELTKLVDNLKNSSDIFEHIDSVKKFTLKKNEYLSLSKIAGINFTMDTSNSFFINENEFIDKYDPVIENINHQFYKYLNNSIFKNELKEVFGEQLFTLAHFSNKTSNKNIIKLLQDENQLKSRYSKLISSSKIPFQGKQTNLTELQKYLFSTNRSLRIEAAKKMDTLSGINKNEFENIFEDLVQIRTRYSKKLGYSNFADYSYDKLKRIGYNQDTIKSFRNNILHHLVPLNNKIATNQAKHINPEIFNFVDEQCYFNSNIPKINGDTDWLVSKANIMYNKLSPKTAEFYKFMMENKLFDLKNRKNKLGGGYCSYIPNIKSPFIFSNLNESIKDLKIFTHEMGHAFQKYCSRNFEFIEYNYPTQEATEIHSISMEFITWPWLNLFVSNTNNYKYYHLSDSIRMTLQYCLGDEFQHIIYENPKMSIAERNLTWLNLEKKYFPYKNYEGLNHFNNGVYWQNIRHFFLRPFYYIDYALAQMIAYQIWEKHETTPDEAITNYINLCQTGGSQPFLKLLSLSGLKSPFEEDTIPSIVKYINEKLDHLNVN